MTRAHALLLNLLLVPASLLALLLGAELFFRFVLPAPDIPAPAEMDGVLRHVPGQRGVYWSGSFPQGPATAKPCAPFSINAQGWNSARADYPLEKGAALRIALVGDSYVEALQVPPDASLAEDLERELAGGPVGTSGGVEVFRYGMSGASLAQYLHMARGAALPARPDVLIVLLVHNDFDESWRAVPGMYTKSFLHVRFLPGGGAEEIPPEPYSQGLGPRLRNASALWRTLAYGWNLRPEALPRLLLPGAPGQAPNFQANIDVSGLQELEDNNRRATAYLMAAFRREAAAAGARLLFVMDGVRASIENASPEAGSPQAGDYGSGALSLNRMAAEEAGRLGIPFLDLHPVFAQDFREQRLPFAFPTDGHWNAHAHAVVARAVARKLAELGWTPPASQ